MGFFDHSRNFRSSNMKSMKHIAIGAAILSLSFAAWAQKPAVYPAKGQSATQQSKDDGECYAWAKQSTGIDPANPPQAAAPQRKGGVVRGAAAGAAVGAIGGNDVGNAAAKGAVVGGVAQRSRNRGAQEASAQQSQQSMQTYNNAYAACMSGRGYTVK
jgi:hypothetical protein